MPLPEDGTPYLRQLISESREMKTKPLPSGWGLTAGTPWFGIAHGVDSPGEWEEDQRQAYVLDKLSQKYPEPYVNLPAQVANEVEAYRRGERKDLQTPYHYRGWYTSGAPLHNIVQSFSAVPSLAYSASALAANAVDPVAPFDPDAKKTWDSSLNTLTGYGAEALGLVPKGTPTYADAAEDARYQRGNNAARREAGMGREEWNKAGEVLADSKVDAMYVDGNEHLQKAGVPPIPALFLGAGMDAVTDPYNGLNKAVKAAKLGKPALSSLLKEFGIGQGMAGAATAMGYGQ